MKIQSLKNKFIDLISLSALLSTFFLMILISEPSFAQNRVDVTGKVVDEAGVPVVGAGVIEKGTMNGTETESDGSFRISVASSDAGHAIVPGKGIFDGNKWL